ncbi:unnamed protein product [Agarophyton chilense]
MTVSARVAGLVAALFVTLAAATPLAQAPPTTTVVQVPYRADQLSPPFEIASAHVVRPMLRAEPSPMDDMDPLTSESPAPTAEMYATEEPTAEPSFSTEPMWALSQTDGYVTRIPTTSAMMAAPQYTNEDNYDRTPVGSRPYPPAACHCMSLDAKCDRSIAGASGVCSAHMSSSKQSGDCHFACCRLCTVNRFVSWCSDPQVVQACKTW